MKLKINQKILSNKINITQRAISNKSTSDLLKGIMILAKKNKLILTGCDSEIGIETHTQADIDIEGSIVVDARLFGDIIRKLPDDLVELEADNENNVYINCVNSKFKIKGYSSNDFPKLPKVNEDNLLEIKQDILKKMIRQTVFATSQDNTKPILMGELFEIDNGKISLVAIDGYRLAVSSQKYDNANKNIKVIIPGKTLMDLNSLLINEDDNVKFEFNEKNAVFIIEDTKITTRLIDGNFIDYNKILPKEYTTKIKLNTKELLHSIERASLLSQADKNNLIKLSIRDNLIAITSNTEKGNVYEEVELELQGEYLDISFNCRYFIEGLKNIDSEEIYMELTTNVNPSIIVPSDGTNYTYLIVPVRT